MAAYLIADNEITNEAEFTEYARQIVAVMEGHGGKYLARGGPTEIVSGERTPHRVVIVQFESLEQAHGCVTSAEYLAIADLRDRSSVTTTILVEGI